MVLAGKHKEDFPRRYSSPIKDFAEYQFVTTSKMKKHKKKCALITINSIIILKVFGKGWIQF